jgi:hypothetical protein
MAGAFVASVRQHRWTGRLVDRARTGGSTAAADGAAVAGQVRDLLGVLDAVHDLAEILVGLKLLKVRRKVMPG